MAQYDLYNIEDRLKEYDENIIRIDFNERQGTHRIICRDPVLYEEYIAMSVPAGELDARVVRRMMEINPRHFNAMEVVERSAVEKERREDSKIYDMARDMAENLSASFRRKPSRFIE